VYWAAANVVAVDAADGSELWHAPPSGDGLFTVSDGLLIYNGGGSAQGGDIIALDTATGRVRWQVPTTSYATASAGADGITYVAMDGNHQVTAFRPDGGQLWTNPGLVGLVPVMLTVGDGVLLGCGT